MRVVVAAWRIFVVLLLMSIVGQLHRIDRSLSALAATPRVPVAAAVRAPTTTKSLAQLEWERENAEMGRRFAERILGPDEAKKLMDRQAASEAQRAAPK